MNTHSENILTKHPIKLGIFLVLVTFFLISYLLAYADTEEYQQYVMGASAQVDMSVSDQIFISDLPSDQDVSSGDVSAQMCVYSSNGKDVQIALVSANGNYNLESTNGYIPYSIRLENARVNGNDLYGNGSGMFYILETGISDPECVVQGASRLTVHVQIQEEYRNQKIPDGEVFTDRLTFVMLPKV